MFTYFINSLNAVLPIFFIMFCGYLARRAGILTRAEVTRVNKLIFYVFLPVLIAYNIHNSDLKTSFNLPFISYAVLGIVGEALVAWIFARRVVKRADQRGVVIQSLFRTNITLMGIQLLANLVPGADLGPLSLLTAFSTLVINTLSVLFLEASVGDRPKPGAMLLRVAKNPMIVGCVVGLLILVLDIRLPTALENTARDMARVASPLSLFLLGAFFQMDTCRNQWKLLASVTTMRLVVLPGLFLGLAALLGFRDIYFASLIPVFASATAAPSFAMVQQVGGDAELAGNLVVSTSLFCSVTIFFWCFLFQLLNLF